MRRACALGLVFIALAGPARPARAETIPSGKLSMVVGVRNGLGELSDAYGLGQIFGIEAAWQPMRETQRVGFALDWGVTWVNFNPLFGYGDPDPASITGRLDLLELSAGARLRIAPTGTFGRYLTVGGGASVLRSNVPLPPQDDRSYIAPFASAGVDIHSHLLWGRVMYSVEVRYSGFSFVANDPDWLSFQLGFGWGY